MTDEQAATERLAILFSLCPKSNGGHTWNTNTGECKHCKVRWPYETDDE